MEFLRTPSSALMNELYLLFSESQATTFFYTSHISKEHAVYRLNSDNIPLAAYSVLGYSYNRIFL